MAVLPDDVLPDDVLPDDDARASAAVALTDALVDDAAVFPPGNLPLADAVQRHRAAGREWWGALVGPLVVPASTVADLLEHAGDDPLDPLTVVLVADSGLGGLEAARNLLLDDDRLDLAGVEIALPPDRPPRVTATELLGELATSVPASVEVPLVPGWTDALDVLAADGAERAKFRCGGSTGAAVPGTETLAAVLLGCVDRNLPFKLTAGLHRAVRGTDRTDGVPHHGFANVLAAVDAGRRGAAVGDLAGILAEERPDAVAALLAGIDGPAAVGVRRSLRSFGSCSITDPLNDLVALGLLGTPTGGGA